ncbi:MAG: DUF6138 family protein [Janthinobacterium lividum]
MDIDYVKNYAEEIAQLAGKEALLDAYVEAVFAGTCQQTAKSGYYYELPGYERCWNFSLILYYLQQKPFELERAKEFLERLYKLADSSFNILHSPFDLWVEATIKAPFFTSERDRSYVKIITLKPTTDPAAINPDYIRFMCFLAVCHLKYGPSDASVTANEYFGMATDLGSDEVAKLKKYGSGTLSKELTEYKDERVSCVANDAFATIKITVKQESTDSYQRVLEFLNALLPTDFPSSYSIEFSSKEKTYLPIKSLPKVGVNALFANAVRYDSLHPLLVDYVRLAAKPHEWYNNLEGETCAKPGTFAVFALGLVGEEYFELVTTYLREVDEEHQEIQTKFTAAFVEKYGITERSLPIFMYCLLSTQSHKHYKVFAEQFSTRPKLEMLLAAKHNFVPYLPEENQETLDPEFLDDGVDTEQQSLIAYLWEDVLNAIFGSATPTPKVLKGVPEDLRPLYTELFAKE